MTDETARWCRRRRGAWISVLAFSAAGLSFLGASGCASYSSARRPPVVVGIVGDQTHSADLQASYRILRQGVDLLAGRDLDVVLHTGDLIDNSRSPEEARADFAQAAAILDRLPAPWYLTAGDHDVNPPQSRAATADRSREALFQELYGARVPAFREHPYYSFDTGGIHFVALYSHETLRADPRWGNVFFARVSDEQLAWLARDLAAHRRAQAIVVFIHQPLWYHWSGWRRVHALLQRYPVAAVVAGHLHYNQDEGELDGIRYLVVPATGALTKEGSPNAGDLQAVTVLRVAGPGRVDVEVLPVEGGGTGRLTPREDMDRVQALDVQLGNLWDFPQRNPLFVKGGRLVASCEEAAPPRLRIDQIGNPIDLPLDVTIDVDSEPPGVALASSGFPPGACVAMANAGVCRLAPGARVEVSNNSTVTIEGICPCAPGSSASTLWEAVLVSEPAQPPAPGTVVSVYLRTSFQGAAGPLYLDRTVRTTVAACP